MCAPPPALDTQRTQGVRSLGTLHSRLPRCRPSTDTAVKWSSKSSTNSVHSTDSTQKAMHHHFSAHCLLPAPSSSCIRPVEDGHQAVRRLLTRQINLALGCPKCSTNLATKPTVHPQYLGDEWFYAPLRATQRAVGRHTKRLNQDVRAEPSRGNTRRRYTNYSGSYWK